MKLLRRYRRMRQALELIGPHCVNYTAQAEARGYTCRTDPHRSPEADFTASRWCDPCIAAYGLDDTSPVRYDWKIE